MIIKKGANHIDLPEACEPETVDIMAYSGGLPERADPGYWMALQRIPYGEMAPKIEESSILGMPQEFAIHPLCKKIIIYPSNGLKREIKIRYCPAMKEI